MYVLYEISGELKIFLGRAKKNKKRAFWKTFGATAILVILKIINLIDLKNGIDFFYEFKPKQVKLNKNAPF